MKRLSIFLPLLCLMACTQYNDIETVVQIQERNISSELVEQTRQQLIGRLQSTCLLYTSPSPRDLSTSRMPSSA